MTNPDPSPSPSASGSPPSSDRRDRFSDREARTLWERALQLQVEARNREEEEALGQRAEDGKALGESTGGYTSDEVEAAAREVGIAPAFMEEALAEHRALALQGGITGRMDRFADWLLGEPDRILTLSRRVVAPPEEVIEAVKRLFPAEPLHLALRDIQGENLFRDGALVYELPGWDVHSRSPSGFSSEAVYAELDLLIVTLRPGDNDTPPASTQLTIRAPLQTARRSHARWTGAVGGLLALAAGGGGATLGAVVGAATGFPPALVALSSALPALAAAVTMGGVSVVGIRRYFRWTLGKGEKALDHLLRRVDLHLRAGESPAPPPAPRRPGDGT